MTSNYDLGHPIQKGLMMHKITSIPSAESTGAMDEAIQHYINEGYMELDKPKGKWCTNRFRYDCTCSNCGCSVYHKDALNFCPNCGADMRGTNGTR